MKKHIVHLSTYPADDIRVFQKACRTEIAHGYRVTQIVCGDHNGNKDGVEIRSVPPVRGRLSKMLWFSWKMYREAFPIRADIYQVHHPDLILAGLLLKLRGRRVIYEPREFFPDKILSMTWLPHGLRRLVSAAFARYERLTSHLWDHIIVADRYSARGFHGLPVSVVPNYPLLIPLNAPRAADRKSRRLIYVGGLSEQRGLFVMLRIAELLRHENVELELMGSFAIPADADAVRAFPNVRYLGNKDLQTVYSHLADSDLGLLLLQPVPAYTYAGENTLKLFEYMWCGLPIVSSDFPNLREIISGARCGICVDPCDAAGAADHIFRLLENAELRHTMSRNGREAVIQAYNWTAAATVMTEAYQNVLSDVRSSVAPLPLWTAAAS